MRSRSGDAVDPGDLLAGKVSVDVFGALLWGCMIMDDRFMKLVNADLVLGSGLTACRGGLVFRVVTVSSALMRLDMPDPNVDFLVSGTGACSALAGGQAGNAVDALRPPEDFVFVRLSVEL